MIALEAAQAQVLASVTPLPSEDVPLTAALRRYAARDILARIPSPVFDNSSVDGYAVQASDIRDASPDQPRCLPIALALPAGSAAHQPLRSGTCARILTGAPLPPDADAVVMQEDTAPSGADAVSFADNVRPWENVRLAGEDFHAGDLIVPRGTCLRPQHLGLVAAAGLDTIAVGRRPRISLFSTGNELRPSGQTLGPGQIPDSNQPLFASLALEAGCHVVRTSNLPDRLEVLCHSLGAAADDSDLIVTTGGVSVGDADLLKPAVTAVGGTVDLWRIAMRPGKPFAFGRIGRALWCGLPGNPVSAFVTWHVLVLPALRRLAGASQCEPRTLPGILAEPLTNRGDRRHFVRVKLGALGEVRSAGPQASHLQSASVHADGLVDLAPNSALPAGHHVTVRLLE